MAVVIFVVLFGGIGVTKSLGYWQTESSKVPAKIQTGVFAGESNPADIRGSYTFGDIVKNFTISLEDLQEAFELPTAIDAVTFQCKSVKENYAISEEDEEEIGTGSVRLFVALYTGLPYDMEEETYLPAAAVAILKEKADLSDAQLEYLEKHTIDFGGLSDSKSQKEQATIQNSVHEENEVAIKGKTTFGELYDMGLTKDQIERVIGYSFNDSGISVRDFCAEKGLTFSAVKNELQRLINNPQEEPSISNTAKQEAVHEVILENHLEQNEEKISEKYNEGTFTGTARGYRSDVKAAVTINNDKIVNIDILSHNESRGYYEEPIVSIPLLIIEKQSVNVDNITGATLTSDAIKNAVEEALKKAEK